MSLLMFAMVLVMALGPRCHGATDSLPMTPSALSIIEANQQAGLATLRIVFPEDGQQEGGGRYRVDFDGKAWFLGGDTCVQCNGKLRCAKDGSLAFVNKSKGKGVDGLGSFQETTLHWETDGVRFDSIFREYLGNDAIVFEQYFPDGMNGTSIGNKDDVISAFPSIVIGESADDLKRGFIKFQGPFAGQDVVVNSWDDPRARASLSGGIGGTGPIVVFSKTQAVVFSVASSFMSMNHHYDLKSETLRYGLMGEVVQVPANYRASVILSGTPCLRNLMGVGNAIQEWGTKLRALYPHRDRESQTETDLTTKYLGFSTDHGAYYYYKTENGKNYQDTILMVFNDALDRGIPYRHWLMDSWWYYKGKGEGLKNWIARPDVFPDGIRAVLDATGWPIVAHNRYFSTENVYAKENGGPWEFCMEPNAWNGNGMALPRQEAFWDHLFIKAKKWGLYTYEQDWLLNVVDELLCVRESATFGRDWLMQMGRAAQRHGVNIQYCMSYPRHVLQAVEIPSVTQIRASKDYHPGYTNWKPLGLTGSFVFALGMVPTKDNFWSNQTLSATSRGETEPNGRLHAAVSTLSRGPVAPSDKIGYADVHLIMRSCAKDGRLLRPDVPAVVIDEVLQARTGLLRDGPTGEIWSTYVNLANTGYYYYIILSAQADALELSLDSFPDNTPFIAWEANSSDHLMEIKHGVSLTIPASTPLNFQFWCFAPRLPNGWTLLGEADDKWVPFSNDRFTNLVLLDRQARVDVVGTPGEIVNVFLLKPDLRARIKLSCKLPGVGQTTIEIGPIDARCLA